MSKRWGPPFCSRSPRFPCRTRRNMSRASADQIRKQYAFRWEIFDIVVNGRSALDAVQGFQIDNPVDADRFIRSYGYDFENSIERAEAYGNFHESLNFIRR